MFHRSSGRVGRSFQSHKRWNGQRLKKDQLPQLARNRAEPCPAQSNKECQHQAKSNFNALKARRHKKLSPPRTYQFTTQSPLPLFGEPLAITNTCGFVTCARNWRLVLQRASDTVAFRTIRSHSACYAASSWRVPQNRCAFFLRQETIQLSLGAISVLGMANFIRLS